MRFFEGCTPEVYIHGAKLRRDKKTGKRLWGLTLIITLDVQDVIKCAPVIEREYEYLLTLENCGVEVLLDAAVMGCIVDFFAAVVDKKPALQLEGLDLAGLRLTRADKTVELWFQFEDEINAGLHAFVKEYAFTRVWARFTPLQGSLAMEVVPKK